MKQESDLGLLASAMSEPNAWGPPLEPSYRWVAEAIPHLVWSTRPDGHCDYLNARFYEFTGLQAEEALGEGWQQALHPDDLPRNWERFRSSAATGQPFEIEYRFRRHDGAYRWFLGRALPVLDESGSIVRWFGTCTDIHEHRRAQDLLELKARAGRELDSSLDYETTLRSVARMMVPAWADWCAVDLLEGGAIRRMQVAHGDPALERYAFEIQERYPPRIEDAHGLGKVLRTGEPDFMREIPDELLVQVARDPEHLAIVRSLGLRSFISVPIEARGRILGALSFVFAESGRLYEETDVEPLAELARRAGMAIENASLHTSLRRSEERFRQLVQNTTEIVWTTEPDGSFRGEQPGWWAYTGQTQSQYEGEGWQDAVHPEDREATLAAWRQALALRSVYAVEHRLRRHDGIYRWFAARASPVLEPDGTLREWVGTHTDITAAKEGEREREALIGALARSNRDLDQFAYVASHDLKAPLRGIAHLSQWIEEDLGEAATETVHEHLRLLRKRAHRMEGLIEGILSYSRAGRKAGKVETVDVGRLLGEVVDMLAVPEGARIDLGAALPVLRTERTQLSQVFLNLIGNALKHGAAAAPVVRIEARPSGDSWYEFSVSDNGAGIDPAFHQRIWGIFQTLEARDKVEGTGIGLAVVKKIVESRGGRAWVESAAGAGATFRFLWPRSEEAEQ
ncbi:PAS domain-containing protein [Vulgatibacter sp.]|uniref:PAS domain-containing sensor histidine kinase n=1 Tax=Vulgatibacter sp. TaxID=1971226 RepID=UPI00356B3319